MRSWEYLPQRTMVFSYKFEDEFKHYHDFNKLMGYDNTLFRMRAHSETDEKRLVFVNLQLYELQQILQYDLSPLISDELLFEFNSAILLLSFQIKNGKN